MDDGKRNPVRRDEDRRVPVTVVGVTILIGKDREHG
jgi:hypothetical protein